MKKNKGHIKSAFFSLALIGIGTLIHTVRSKKKRIIIKREDVKEEGTFQYNSSDDKEE